MKIVKVIRHHSLLASAIGIVILGGVVATTLLTVGHSSGANGTSSSLLNVKDPKPAPELTGISAWINSNGETIKGLRGKVVLVDFWTYSCINCLRSLPHVEGWYQKYQKQGLVVIGVHAPEFAFEHNLANVQKAVEDNGISYPVALDNQMATWNAYGNQYWPAEYLIDREGKLRRTDFGEGEYSQSEQAIQLLLGDQPTAVSTAGDTPPISAAQSPETYLGYGKGSGPLNAGQAQSDQTTTFSSPTAPGPSQWTLNGPWNVGSEQLTSESDSSQLTYNFSAKDVYLVMDGQSDTGVGVKVNGLAVSPQALGGADINASGHVPVNGARLYRLVNAPQFLGNAVLQLTVPKGIKLNAFTFGS